MNDTFSQLYYELLEKTTQRLDSKCWKGYTKKGTKTIKKNGKKTRVNNCVKVNESYDEDDNLLSLGFDLHAIGELIKQLQKYNLKHGVVGEGAHYQQHIAPGDDLPNAITIHPLVWQKLGPGKRQKIEELVDNTFNEPFMEKNTSL